MATLLNTINGVTLYRADRCDVNGNPRVIVHFLDFLTDDENDRYNILDGYELAARRARRAGFRRYTAREFGGGGYLSVRLLRRP